MHYMVMLRPEERKAGPMRVAIVENTRITHHGQVGVALHEQAALVEIFRPWGRRRPAGTR